MLVVHAGHVGSAAASTAATVPATRIIGSPSSTTTAARMVATSLPTPHRRPAAVVTGSPFPSMAWLVYASAYSRGCSTVCTL